MYSILCLMDLLIHLDFEILIYLYKFTKNMLVIYFKQLHTFIIKNQFLYLISICFIILNT